MMSSFFLKFGIKQSGIVTPQTVINLSSTELLCVACDAAGVTFHLNYKHDSLRSGESEHCTQVC